MNKIILVVICVCLALGGYSQKKVGTYTNLYFDKEYSINASVEDNKYLIYIEVPAKGSDLTMVQFEGTQLEDLTAVLEQIKNKFEEWSEVARNNNVKKMTKDMDFKLPRATICWHGGSKWFFAFGEELVPTFRIMDDGKYIVSLFKKVVASSNKYIDESIYWVLSSSKEIDELIDQLNFTSIKEKLGEDNKTNELFQ